ncbi:MAG TPA: hypothetical protein VMU84_13960 [Thermoanaerobaculia bacterium]|nr:hypothetical protein [Thermoanaerobaculia bacterium]
MTDLLSQFAAMVEQSSAAGGGSIELLVAQLGDEGELVRRCAITHQFTPAVLRVLDPSLDPAEAEARFHRLARLSLVIRSPDGLALHDRAREQLFAGWLVPERIDELRTISARLTFYLGALTGSAAGAEREKLVRRHLFHLIAVDQDAGIDAFEKEFETSRERVRYTACDNLLRMAHEYDPILTPANRGRVAYREAKLALDRGAPGQALSLFTSVAAEPAIDPPLRAKALNGIGLAHADECHWKSAAIAFLDALRFAAEHKETRVYRAGFLQNLAAVYRNNGYIEPAESLLTEAAILAAGSHNGRVIASVCNAFGTLYLRGEEPGKAIASLRESLEHLDEDDFARSRVYNNLGLACMRASDLPASEEWFNRSLEMKALAGDTVGQANTNINLVRLYREQQALDKAVGAAATAADLFERVFFWKEAGDANAMLARFYLEAKKPAETVRAMAAAFNAYERAHADEESENLRNEMRHPSDDEKRFRLTAGDMQSVPGRGSQPYGIALVQQDEAWIPPKRPPIAAILSVIVIGLGQVYNGDWKKGLVMFLSFIGCSFPLLKLGGDLGRMIFPVVLIAIAIWSSRDAWRVAHGKAPRW